MHSAGADVGKSELSYIIDGSGNWHNLFGGRLSGVSSTRGRTHALACCTPGEQALRYSTSCSVSTGGVEWHWPQSPGRALQASDWAPGGEGGSRAQGLRLLGQKEVGGTCWQVLLDCPCTCAFPCGHGGSQVCRPPAGGSGDRKGGVRCGSAPW